MNEKLIEESDGVLDAIDDSESNEKSYDIGYQRFVDDVNIQEEKPNFELKRLPRLEIIFDRFARIVTDELSNYFHIRIEFNSISIEHKLFGQIMRTISTPSGICILDVPTLQTNFISLIGPRFIFPAVEVAMGNTMLSSSPKIEGRDFTQIERIIINDINNIITHCLEQAFEELIADIEISTNRLEVNPKFVTDLNTKDDCIITHFEVEFGVSLANYYLVLPVKPFLPIMTLLENQSKIKVLYNNRESYNQVMTRKYKTNSKYNDEYKYCNNYKDKRYFQSLLDSDEETIALILRNEHPQTLACIFSFLPPKFCANFILSLPAGARAEVIKRMKNIVIGQPMILDKIDDYIKKFNRFYFLEQQDKSREVLKELETTYSEVFLEIQRDLRDYQ